MQKCVYKHKDLWKIKRLMENLTVFDHIQHINIYFTRATSVIIACLVLLLTILEGGRSVFVVTNLRKAFAKRRRIKIENDTQDKTVCNAKITQGKFLLALIILEYISIFSTYISNFYPQLHHISPVLDILSLPFNSTCIITIDTQRIWIQEIQYPVTTVFLSIVDPVLSL